MSTPSWLLNMSVSHHMTPKENQVPNATSYLGIIGAMLGNGDKILISKVGNGSLFLKNDKCLLHLNDLLYITNAATNLILVLKLCSKNQVFLEFHSNLSCIKDLAIWSTIFQGVYEQGLYKIDGKVS